MAGMVVEHSWFHKFKLNILSGVMTIGFFMMRLILKRCLTSGIHQPESLNKFLSLAPRRIQLERAQSDKRFVDPCWTPLKKLVLILLAVVLENPCMLDQINLFSIIGWIMENIESKKLPRVTVSNGNLDFMAMDLIILSATSCHELWVIIYDSWGYKSLSVGFQGSKSVMQQISFKTFSLVAHSQLEQFAMMDFSNRLHIENFSLTRLES